MVEQNLDNKRGALKLDSIWLTISYQIAKIVMLLLAIPIFEYIAQELGERDSVGKVNKLINLFAKMSEVTVNIFDIIGIIGEVLLLIILLKYLKNFDSKGIIGWLKALVISEIILVFIFMLDFIDDYEMVVGVLVLVVILPLLISYIVVGIKFMKIKNVFANHPSIFKKLGLSFLILPLFGEVFSLIGEGEFLGEVVGTLMRIIPIYLLYKVFDYSIATDEIVETE